MATKIGNLLIKNGTLLSKSISAADFLKQYPRGAYTTTRTVHRPDRIEILEWEMHLERLTNSCTVMLEDQSKIETLSMENVKSVFCNREKLQSIVEPHIQDLIKEFYSTYPDSNLDDLKLTILLSWEKDSAESIWQIEVFIHATNLPKRPDRPVVVDIRRGSRVDLKAKDSIWVQRRDHLLQIKTNQANEVILCEDDGTVREGCSSNFYVIQQGKLITSREDVIEGTILKKVLQVCHALEIPMEFKNPNLKDLDSWDEMFISSTSRLVLPVQYAVIASDCVGFITTTQKDASIIPNTKPNEKIKEFQAPGPITSKIYEEVLKHL